MANTHDFVINFIAQMGQLDTAIGTLPAKMAKAQTMIQQGLAGGVTTPRMTADLGKHWGVMQQGVGTTNQLKKAIADLNPKTEVMNKNMAKSKKSFMDAFTGADTLSSVIGKVVLWTVATTAVFGLLRAITELTQRSIELEKHFADLKRVLPTSEIKAFENQIFGMAHAFGVATTDVVDATFEWGKTTKSLTDIIYGQQAAILAVKVGELELADSTRFLTALYHSMGLRGQELIGVIDQLNALQNEFGANIKGTMEVLARSGGIIKAYGGDLKQTMALAAAALKLTGEQPSKVATLFRRLPDYLEQNQDKLQVLGVEIRKADGSYFSLEHQITSLMEAYTKQDEEGKKAIRTLSAEGRSRGILTTLLQNQDVFMAMLNETYGAAGSAAIEYSQIMDTTSEKMARLNATFDELATKSDVTDPIGRAVDSFDAMLRSILIVNDSLDVLINKLDQIPVKLPGGIGVGEAAGGITRGAATSTFLGIPTTAPFAAVGKLPTVKQVKDVMDQELEQAKGARERSEVYAKYGKEIGKAILGVELTPETKARISIQELQKNREKVAEQTKEDIRLDIQQRIAYAMKIIEEEGKAAGASKKTIDALKEQEKVRSKLMGGLSEQQKLEEDMAKLDLAASLKEYNAGQITAKEYQERINMILGELPEGTEGWIEALEAGQKQMDALVKSQQGLAGAAAELKGEGGLEAALREQQDATDTYNRIRKEFEQGKRSEEELNNAKAASYRAGAKAREAKEEKLRAYEALALAFSKSELQTAEMELTIAENELDRTEGSTEKMNQKAVIEQKRRALIDAIAAQQQLLYDVQESAARTEIEAIRIAFARARLMKKVADTFEEEQAAIIAANEATLRQEEYNKKLIEARAQLEIATIRDPLERTSRQIEHAYEMLALEQDELKQLAILARIESLRVTQMKEIHDIEKARSEAAAAIRAETAAYEKAKKLRMDYFNQEKNILDMRQELGEITVHQQIEAIRKLAEGVELTREQSYQLRLELLRLQEEAEAEKREAFNLPGIVLPTMYEIRRSIQGGYQQGGGGDYNDNREVNIFVSDEVGLEKVREVITSEVGTARARGLSTRRY
jgi:TP901 family phage tail tape measure protein